jgi:hypothetical protein
VSGRMVLDAAEVEFEVKVKVKPTDVEIAEVEDMEPGRDCTGAPGLLQRVNEVKTTAANMTKREVIMATLKLCSCSKK